MVNLNGFFLSLFFLSILFSCVNADSPVTPIKLIVENNATYFGTEVTIEGILWSEGKQVPVSDGVYASSPYFLLDEFDNYILVAGIPAEIGKRFRYSGNLSLFGPLVNESIKGKPIPNGKVLHLYPTVSKTSVEAVSTPASPGFFDSMAASINRALSDFFGFVRELVIVGLVVAVLLVILFGMLRHREEPKFSSELEQQAYEDETGRLKARQDFLRK